MSFKCILCPTNGRCVRCQALNANERANQRAKDKAVEILDRHTYSGCAEHDPWLLPDDEVTDLQAVSVAVHGERAVRLTRKERLLAARQILAYGGSEHMVVIRLTLQSEALS